jgi:hypothetical protein
MRPRTKAWSAALMLYGDSLPPLHHPTTIFTTTVPWDGTSAV